MNTPRPSRLAHRYAKAMQALALAKARAVKGKPLAYKRGRYIRDALYWRLIARLNKPLPLGEHFGVSP